VARSEHDHSGSEREARRRPSSGGRGQPDDEREAPERQDRERPARRRTDRERDDRRPDTRRRDEDEPPRIRRRAAVGAREAARQAARQVLELTGNDPLGVVFLEQRSEGGWNVGVEVLESRRIPDSTDILAVYRVEVDERGDLLSYRRERRYFRGRAEDT